MSSTTNIESSILALGGIFPPDQKLLIAVSGGPDSLVLLHALYTHRTDLQLSDLAVVHYDHGLREESAEEAQFVSDYCQKLGIQSFIGQSPRGELYNANHGSMQETARLARYQFIESTAGTWNADYIATAHHQDDQIETVLINILRGTGIDGLCGIPYQRGRYIRPFLSVSRADIEQYGLEHQLAPRRDQSNNDPSHYLRNKIRLKLLPELTADYHPGVKASILRLSHSADIDSDYLQSTARQALETVSNSSTVQALRIDLTKLLTYHIAIQRRVIRLAVLKIRGTCEGVTEDHIETVRKFCGSDIQPCSITIPNPLIHVTRRNFELVIEVPHNEAVAQYNIELAQLPMNTPVSLPNGWCIIVMHDDQAYPDNKRPSPDDNEFKAIIDRDKVDISKLRIRNWQAGDRIDPLGMQGKSKKVQDLFVNAKLPITRRATWPIVADEQIAMWVPGITISEKVKIDDTTRNKLCLFLLLPALLDTIDFIEPQA